MAPSRIAVWLFMLAAGLFLVVALLPVVRGGRLNATFLALAVVFFVLGVGVARRSAA
ncbi:MAG: hypothetical protein ACREMH_10095 [Gemmatimonadales bacterium]